MAKIMLFIVSILLIIVSIRLVIINSSNNLPIPVVIIDPEYIPTNARNVSDLGNNWITFELEIDGKNHKFLYHSNHRNWNSAVEAITEINP